MAPSTTAIVVASAGDLSKIWRPGDIELVK
jgi:hypothetical protein